MKLKDFQEKVLERLDDYVNSLSVAKERFNKLNILQKETPDLDIPIPDFTLEAWKTLDKSGVLPEFRKDRSYCSREDDTGTPVPNICLKVPTGGGKTLLAVSAVSKVFTSYYQRHTGVVLWIVPNEAIYTQTKKALVSRDHPYRQLLDKVGASRVKILEKNSPLHQADVESHLCVFLLMLQSSNRENKDTLKMFRDRGNVRGFFPNEDDYEGNIQLLRQIPNLDCYGDGKTLGSIVKSSLGNVMRLVRPMVVVDEGHRATSTLALKTLYGFNPSFVLELSATPKDRDKESPPSHSNWLVDVCGRDLEQAELIKLPINVAVQSSGDWKNTLRDSLNKLNQLQTEAEDLNLKTYRYVRPILLVQVQRTGKEQRDSGYIHSQDVSDYLEQLGLNEETIAIKTADKNDLNQPENIDLLSPACAVRVIITKQALQEGWDCPFAYVLCSLAAGKSLSAMTQLSGRILRQPHAMKTEYESLNQCYIYCHHASTGEVVKSIKKSLENDGMGDIVNNVNTSGDNSAPSDINKRIIKRREGFRELEILLPRVLWVDAKNIRELDYEKDILYRLDWKAIRLDELAQEMPKSVQSVENQVLKINLEVLSSYDKGVKNVKDTDSLLQLNVVQDFDLVYISRAITDLVPNAWIAWSYVEQLVTLLRKRGFDDSSLSNISSFMVSELRNTIIKQRDKLAEITFIKAVESGSIQFRLRTDNHNWKMPKQYSVTEGDRPLYCDNTGKMSEKSLFDPVYESELNGLEKTFACYLENDKTDMLKWWHRNIARCDYALQGWKKHKIYPDFIFAMKQKDKSHQIVVMETKGLHLQGNEDTEYKQELLKKLTSAYQIDFDRNGTLQIENDGIMVKCDMVFEDDWEKKLNAEYLNGS